MKIKITRNTIANKEAVNEGEVLDLPDAEAKFLIAIGKAVEVNASGFPKRNEGIETADAQHSKTEQAIKPSVKK